MIDLRSDTITQPTPAMRQAMAEAAVGDDVFGDDPTVQALEHRVATMLGHEAALFVPSGTMSNALAIRVHCQPGDEMIAEAESHIFLNEVGGAAALSGVQIQAVRAHGGILTAARIAAAIRTEDVHHPETRLIAIENTHNYAGGVVQPLGTLQEVAALARERGLRMHLDGARLWNAAAETGVPLATCGSLFDSVSVCLSKGLGAPIGSLLVGSADFVARARRFRKMFGGGMRQVGILAAAGLYALDHHLSRLRQDHDNARVFADLACRVPGVSLAQERVETNIVFLDPSGAGRDAFAVAEGLAARGVRVIAVDAHRFRAVFHLHIGEEDARRAAACLAEVLGVPQTTETASSSG